MDKFTVIRDTREKRGQGYTFEEDPYCQGTIIKKVEAGDYTVEGLEDFICIERKKTIDEFAQNCVQSRLYDWLARMSECKHSYLILEFTWDDVDNYPMSSKAPIRVKRQMKISPKFIRRILNDIRDDYGIHILACGNSVAAEKAAYRLLKKAHEIRLRR